MRLRLRALAALQQRATARSAKELLASFERLVAEHQAPPTWAEALALARAGDPAMLVRALGHGEVSPMRGDADHVPFAVRRYLAELVEENRSARRGGPRGLPKSTQDLIRVLDEFYRRSGSRISRAAWRDALAQRFRRSRAVIEEITATKRRRGYR